MNYKANIPSEDISQALSLTEKQVKTLKTAIENAYVQQWHESGPNVDQIYAFVAPYINSPEEAFYVASVVLTDVLGAIIESRRA